MSKLQKRQVVMGLLAEQATGDVQFAQHAHDEDNPDLGDGLFLMAQNWEDMGKPETITVTVEPGDTING